MRLIASFVLALATALSQVAMAQEPPTRVGRLAFTEGSVALYQDPDEGWEKAYVNSPVTSENSIWTDPSARAEMRVSGVALRLDQSTQLDVVKLDDDELQAFVAQGSIAVRVRHFANAERLDFATPHAGFRLYGVGRYRIDVDPDRDETVLTVFAGTASMRSASGDVKVDAGSAIRVAGGANPSFARLRAATNAFDNWTLARDKGWIETRSVQYVSTDMTGYEDLDRYGSWVQEPDYGTVWFPSRVARDWVPYRQGHWDYVRPWGWTWIADEPWGYAPYHYGRWVYVRDRWGWYPGPRTARPAWAPALVAFVGGANFSVGISGGSAPALGWYPLAPWERYEPWYRTNTAYVNRINVSVRDQAPRQWAGRDRAEWRYANRDQGATVVRRDAFAGRRNVAQDVMRVTPDILRQAQVAQPTAVLPVPERRTARPAGQAPAPQAGRAGMPSAAPPPQAQAPAEQSFRRPGERGAPAGRPNFERRQAAPAPAPAPATAQQPAPPQPAAAAPSRRPDARDDQRTQERAAREQQQAQERAAREAQQGQQQQQQAQERAAREAQQAQQQQRQTQERAAREAQQAQERAAREAQQQQQQRQAQERGAREQQQGQERAAREAQQQQQRQAQEQQQQQQAQERAAREQQQAQERAAREAQRGQPAAQPPAAPAAQPPQRGQPAAQPPAAPPAAAPAAPPAQPPQRGEPQREQPRGRDKDDDDKPGKGRDDDKPGKGRGR